MIYCSRPSLLRKNLCVVFFEVKQDELHSLGISIDMRNLKLHNADY